LLLERFLGPPRWLIRTVSSFVRLQAVRCAQRGGVGLIIYFQKEGRSLGEVTKFRVYNARKAQKGGDTAENYFYVTESIAGIRDARVQEIMPDVVRSLEFFAFSVSALFAPLIRLPSTRSWFAAADARH
jgi:GTP cyclohydrolase II